MRLTPNCPHGPTGYHCNCWYAGLYCHFCDADKQPRLFEGTPLNERGEHPIYTSEYLDAHIKARRKHQPK